MKTQTPNTEVTARPWQVNESRHAAGRCALGYEIVAGIRHIADVRVYEPCDQANTTLIVQAVNQFEALNAVAEAAERFLIHHKIDGHVSSCQCWGCDVRKALSALETLRK